MIEDIDPERYYSTGQAAKLIPSARREGCQHPSTLNKAVVKGTLKARRVPGGFVIKGHDLLKFLDDYNTAHGVAFDPDPSDSSDSSAASAARLAKARDRSAARAAGTVSLARAKAAVRGRHK
jgi:hypothetical protein